VNMTKPAKEVIAQQEQITDTVTSVFDEEQSARWMRDSALGFAMTHHKHNGGMTTPQQLVDNANVFLNFLKGEAL
jgi:hypothetical protein